MKLLIFALLLAFLSVSFAWEEIGYLKDPAHPGKCVHGDLVLSPGEEGKVKGHCIQVFCGEDSFAKVQGCGVEDAAPPCIMGDYIDLDAPYAKCCDRHIICP